MSLVEEVNYFYYHMSMHELQLMNESDYFRGISYNSLLYLNVIDQIHGCTVSKMADALNVTKSAVTIKVNELVKQGFVVKTQSEEDKRVFYLCLSPDMRKTMGIYDRVFEKIEHELKKKYTMEQLALFEDVLHSISGYEWRKI